LRILQVCDTYPPDRGGLGTHVRRLGERLVDRGHDVMVVAAGPADASQSGDAFPVRRVKPSLARVPGVYLPESPPFHPPWPDRRFVKGVERAAERFDPDVVHAHGWCTYSAVRCTPAWSLRVVSTLHDHGLACPKKTLLRFGRECQPARGTACLRCDEQSIVKRGGQAAALAIATPPLERRIRRLLAVSTYVAARTEEVGVSSDLLDVVPNFVDIPGPEAAGPPADDVHPYVLYAGPVAPHKGLQVLLEAFGRVPGPVELHLAGTDGTVSAPRVVDLGYQSGGDLAALYRDALMLVVPSIWADPCPTVALEAMAWGTPVVGSALGGLTDIVVEGVTGLLVPPGDPDALHAAITRLVAEPGLRDEMGRRSRERVSLFSTDVVIPKLEAIYASL